LNGYTNGEGTFYFKNGNKYVGSWIYGKRTGAGIMSYAEGGRYEGQFLNDKNMVKEPISSKTEVNMSAIG
jgi:hypothetical protein